MYGQVHQEQIAAGETTENIAEIPVVQEQVVVQEIPEVVDAVPPVQEFTEPGYNQVHHDMIVTVEMTQNIIENSTVQEQVIVPEIPPVDEQIQEQIVETIDVTLQRSQFAPSTSSTSTRQFDIPSSSSTSTTNDRLDELASMLDSCREQLTLLANLNEELERLETLIKPEPPMLEPSSATSSAKRRRRTRFSPLPGIMEHAVYLAPSAWPPVRHA